MTSAQLPGRGESLWTATADVAPRPPLAGDLRVAAVVVGAGMTGVCAAYELQRAGVETVLLDQGTVGGGVTGHTTAKLSALHGIAYKEIAELHGATRATSYARINARGLERIASLTAEHAIACDFRRRPAFLYATTAEELDRVEEEAWAAHEAGLAVEIVEDVPLPFATRGAARLAGQAEFHPLRFVAGLADAFEAAGGRIHERTRVTSAHDGEPCTLQTEDGGTVTADHAILATHIPFADRALYFARMHPERSYALAVRLASGAVPDGMLLSAGSPTRSIRAHPVDGEELLLVGGDGHKVGQGPPTAEHYRALEAFAREHWDVAEVSYRWSAQDNMPADALPYVGPLTPRSKRTLVATGYRKWGLALGAEAGAMLRDLVLGVDHADADTLDPGRVPPVRALRDMAKEGADFSYRFAVDRLRQRGRASDELAPGEGRVVSLHGRQVALSRDDDGTVRAVSARCTHLGCIVAYNDAERSWDCPCHGSRFALDGEVLQGPAVHPLEPKDPPT